MLPGPSGARNRASRWRSRPQRLGLLSVVSRRSPAGGLLHRHSLRRR